MGYRRVRAKFSSAQAGGGWAHRQPGEADVRMFRRRVWSVSEQKRAPWRRQQQVFGELDGKRRKGIIVTKTKAEAAQ